jgi:hypothetical protein
LIRLDKDWLGQAAAMSFFNRFGNEALSKILQLLSVLDRKGINHGQKPLALHYEADKRITHRVTSEQ